MSVDTPEEKNTESISTDGEMVIKLSRLREKLLRSPVGQSDHSLHESVAKSGGGLKRQSVSVGGHLREREAIQTLTLKEEKVCPAN